MNILLFALAFAIAGILVWKLWKPLVLPAKREIPSTEARLLFFYTNWCGFSKKAMPEWEGLEALVKTTPIFGTTRVTPVSIDAEADQALASTYEVEGYPTVLLETHTGIIPYTKRVTTAGLKEFLRSQLGQERSSL
jgi:thiol-disulfide isomerase/thioredoxin